MVIKDLQPTGFASPFGYDGKNYTVEGQFTADAQKNIENITGCAMVDGVLRANFNGVRISKEKMRYNFTEIQDLSELANIATEVDSAVKEIETELK